jgi:hypothetical protein
MPTQNAASVGDRPRLDQSEGSFQYPLVISPIGGLYDSQP